MMKKYNILVTGVGAIIGYGLINSLRKSKYDVYIVGMDIYEDAYGRYISDEFVQAIFAADKQYPEFLKKIIEDKDIDLVMFGTEQEIQRCIESKDELQTVYNKLVLNNIDIVNLSGDKWLTYEFLKINKFPLIESRIEGDFESLSRELGCPFLLKPRKSYASKGIAKINDVKELEQGRVNTGAQFMVQKIVGDMEHEYTAATFGFGDGTCLKPIILQRKLSQEGATSKAKVVNDQAIVNSIIEMSNLLKPVGPTNFQFRYDDEKPVLLEINPRISSSTSIRMAFGYNEAEMCIEYFVDKKRPIDKEIKKGSAVRFIADYINIE